MSKIVTNTSPLIVLAKAGLLPLLPAIFDEVVAPSAVIDEIAAGPADDPMKNALPSSPWLRVIDLNPPLSPLASFQLGRGESEAIEFARRNPGWELLVDDRVARRMAAIMRLPVMGTVAVAGIAAQRQLVTFDDAVQKLRSAGLFVTDKLVDSIRLRLQTP
jgi:predicted nucleic acid-binding protein